MGKQYFEDEERERKIKEEEELKEEERFEVCMEENDNDEDICEEIEDQL